MARVLVSPAESRLLRDFADFLPEVIAKMEEGRCWRGYLLEEPDHGHSYERLECLDHLVVTDSRVEYSVALHRFVAIGSTTAMHDHRWPLAVLPLDPSGQTRLPLYEMPWEHRTGGRVLDSGVIEVRSGAAWAIEEHREIFHAVRSLRPHFSVVVADVTQGASRENRLHQAALSDQRSDELRQAVAKAVRSAGLGRA